MTSVREAAANLQALHDALNICGANYQQGYIDLGEYQIAMDRLTIDHAIAVQRAQSTQDEMNAASEAYIKSEWAKNHPPEPERILPWQLSRDDLAELRLWWDWKELPDDVKSEMLPPPSPSEMTQAFMETNPAWRFSPAGTLVAFLTDEGGKDDGEPWLNRAWVQAFACTGLVTGLFFLVFVLAPMITGH